MCRRVAWILWIVVVAGCSAPQPTGGVLSSAALPAPQANLALGPSADHAYFASLGPLRSDWPSVDNGYRSEEVTFYSRASYDAQFDFDRYNSLYHESDTVQTGVLVR